MGGCKNICEKYERGNKVWIYENKGCFCRNCDRYYRELFLRCPCCHYLTRQNKRSDSKRKEICRI